MRSEQRWSRRQFLGATSLMAAGTMLAACTPKATESPDAQPAQAEGQAPAPAGTSITIQYWVFWNQLAACEEAWRATDEWKEIESNNITLEFKTGAGGDAGRTAVAAGTPCDVGDLGPQRDFMIGGNCFLWRISYQPAPRSARICSSRQLGRRRYEGTVMACPRTNALSVAG